MLHCPVCHRKEMVILELDAVEIDHCISCGGVWLDAGELDLLLGGSEKEEMVARLLRPIGATCTERRRPCPICGTAMMKCAAEECFPGLLLDRCPAGHGIWFDAGELQRLLSFPACGAEARVISLIKDMFAAQKPNTRGG